MKPDGKIQGVDVWVRPHGCTELEWCLADGPNAGETKMYCDDRGGLTKYGAYSILPSREDALAHLRQLEAKERLVIDLSTAKFGDKFKRGDGKIETYACPQEGNEPWHLMQSGNNYLADGRYTSNGSEHRDLVAPYTPPRTVEVWIEVYERPGCKTIAAAAYMSEAELRQGLQHSINATAKTIATRKITLTEGEGLAEPDVA